MNTTERTARDLNTMERTDAIARIARKLTSYVKAEQLELSFITDVKNTTIVFSYDSVMKGLTVFNNGKLTNMPNKEYHVTITTPYNNLSNYVVTFDEKDINRGQATELDIAICNKFAEDLKADLISVNLLPLTRTRKN